MVDIKFLTNELGDWEGLYIDDELVLEEHSIDINSVMKCLKNKLPINYRHIEATEDQLRDWGYTYPKDIAAEEKL